MAPRGKSPAGAGAGAGADADVATAAVAASGKPNYVPPTVLESYHAPVMGEQYEGFLGTNFADQPLWKRLNWLHVPLLVVTPLVGIYGLLTAKFYWQTWLFTYCFYLFSGFGITAGYHRLWAHKAYKVHPALELFLLAAGTSAVEGSVRWWSRDHRAHHRYVDTEKDPYCAVKGFWYAHMGWMMVKQDKSKIGRVDISDLDANPWLRFQHRYYLPLVLLAAFVFPTLVCGLWGDWYGGYFIAGAARLVVVHHSTFFVNSLAHYAGDATYTDRNTARTHLITALLTLGEGNHSYHHMAPHDYRNAVEWYGYDPTKIFIWACAQVGLAYDLVTFPRNEIEKARLQMRQKALDAEKTLLYWGPDPAALPVITKDAFAKRVADGEALVILDGFVLDVGKFVGSHPGGPGLIKVEYGNDISEKFKGAYYAHSTAARNLAATYRIARLQGYW